VGLLEEKSHVFFLLSGILRPKLFSRWLV